MAELEKSIWATKREEPTDWAEEEEEEESGECQPNPRLTDRLMTIARQFYGHPMVSKKPHKSSHKKVPPGPKTRWGFPDRDGKHHRHP